VLLACQAIFDLKAAQTGKLMLQWQPRRGTRVGLIALDGSSMERLDADPFFAFHFGNTYERNGQLVVEYVRHERLDLGYATPSQRGRRCIG
jgi:carotenoid cleavage dioxygenase-like enzyme